MKSLYVNHEAVRASLQARHPWVPDDILDHIQTSLIEDLCYEEGIDQVGSILPPDALLLTDLEECPEDADFVPHAAKVISPGPSILELRTLPETEAREVQNLPAGRHYLFRWALRYVPVRDAALYARNGLIPSISAYHRDTLERAQKADPPVPRPLPQEGQVVVHSSRSTARYQLVSPATLQEFLDDLAQATRLGWDTETTFVPGWPDNPEKKAVRKRWDQVVHMSCATRVDQAWYLDCRPDSAFFVPEAFQALERALTDPGLPKVGHNLPFDLQAVQHTFGITVQGELHDTQVMCWLLGHEAGRQGLKQRAWEDLGIRMTTYEELTKGRDMNQVDPREAAEYGGPDAELPLRLMDLYLPLLEERDLTQAYRLEQRMTRILHRISWKGMYVDTERLTALLPALEAELAVLQDRSFPGINIKSPVKLPEYLYRTCGYQFSDPTKRKKSGLFSTDKETIKRLLFDYPSDQRLMDLLRMRELTQLKGTFIGKLPLKVNPGTGRIHAGINSTVARTTRLTMNDPNLQQVPARTTLGKAIRACFTGQDGKRIGVADLAQIEARYMAHVTQSPFLREIFQGDKDLYRELASRFYKVSPEEITKEQRQYGKVIGLGSQFGAQGYKISMSTLDPLADPPFMIPPDEADRLLQIYLGKEAPEVRQFARQMTELVREQGYVTTHLGYRRYLPDIEHHDFAKRSQAERQANNTPIQGGAAEVIKTIMAACEDAGILDYMIGTVHDELLLEGTEAELNDLMPLLVEIMQTAYPLSVPVKAEAGIGPDWASAKD